MRFPFGRQKQSSENTSEYKVAEVYQGLRNQVLSLNPAELFPEGGDMPKVWGVLMEMGYSKAVVTLVALADSTASLYYSTGGGIIGAGQHEGPAKAALALIDQAAPYVAQCERVQDYPLPQRGNVRFYLLTFDGVFSTEAPEDDLGYNRHALSPLFYAAQALIGEMRMMDEQANR